MVELTKEDIKKEAARLFKVQPERVSVEFRFGLEEVEPFEWGAKHILPKLPNVLYFVTGLSGFTTGNLYSIPPISAYLDTIPLSDGGELHPILPVSEFRYPFFCLGCEFFLSESDYEAYENSKPLLKYGAEEVLGVHLNYWLCRLN